MEHKTSREQSMELLEKYSEGRIPVQVIDIAKKLGITVFSDPDYPEFRSGHIQIDDSGAASIIVNAKHSSARKRFTIAHEICHFINDMDYLRRHKVIDRDGSARDPSYRMREKRANEFAAELLMPEEQFVDQWIALEDIEDVANYFGVSKPAALIRATNLGLITSE